MSRPSACHPANNVIVQELSLLASLMYFSTAHPHAGPRKGNLFTAARTLASSHVSFGEISAFSNVPRQLKVDPFPHSVALNRYMRTLQWIKHSQPDKKNVSSSRGTEVMAPGKAIALFAPFWIPPSLPQNTHDYIHYDEACQHAKTLGSLLEPYGLTVSLSGATRRGCPVGTVGEYIVALTEQATKEVESVKASTEEEDEKVTGSSRVGMIKKRRMRQGDKLSSIVQKVDAFSVLANYELEEVDQAAAFEVEDYLSNQVAHRLRRAVEGLIRSGYVGAGRVPTNGQWGERSGKRLWVRYDPADPAEMPPHHHPHVNRLRLHCLILHHSPWQCYHVRRLFYTGPPAFVTFMNLKALEMGYELNLNGLFLVQKDEAGGTATVYKRILVRSEQDIFSILGVPFVDPMNRGIFCQIKNLSQ